jgi:hypothetical protein
MIPKRSIRRLAEALVTLVVTAALYDRWLMAPVLGRWSFEQWRYVAAAAAFVIGLGSTAWIGVIPVSLSAIGVGLLVGGTWADWTFPDNVPHYLLRSFAFFVEMHWQDLLRFFGAATIGAIGGLSVTRAWAVRRRRPHPVAPLNAKMYESSMNFDLKDVQTFLSNLNERLQLALPVDDLVAATESTPIDAESRRALITMFNGESVQLEYRVFMDDIDAPDLYFFTGSEELSKAIDSQLSQFAEEHGI